MGPSGRFTHVMIYCTVGNMYMRVLYLGRAPRTKETLPDFHEKCRVARHSRVFHGLTGSQRTPGIWGITRVVVPQLTDLREEILREFHYSRFFVHAGGTKMYQDLRHQYYWSGIKRHIGDFFRRCLTCQQVKAEHQKPAGLLQPLEVAERK